jgi:HAMP domain-containing protein
MSRLLGFPNPVNEKAARTVAAGVLIISTGSLVLSLTDGTAWLWLVALLAAGFLARVLTGPTLSPLGQLATRVIAPRLGPPNPVPGPPKRFAQGIGLLVTAAATMLLAVGQPVATQVLLGVMIVAAGLESILAYCIGCRVFAALMWLGVIPETTCAACANIGVRTS